MINEVDLPVSWEICNIFDISEPKQWKTIATKDLLETGYPVYGANGKIGFFNEYNHEDPALMITCRGATCGEIHISEPYAYINGNAMCLDNIPKLMNFKYLFYYLKNFNFSFVISVSAQPQITQSGLKAIDIPIPPVNEQNRIVDKIETLFSEVDAGIENLTLAKRQLGQYRQSLLKHAFEGKLTAKWREEYAEKHGKSLPSADELLEQIQTARQDYYDQQIADWEQAVKSWEEQGKEWSKPRKPTKPKELLVLDSSDLPHEWVVVEFEGICELIRNGLSLKPEGHEGTKILRISAVRAFSLNLDDYRYLSSEHEVPSFLLQQGDLLFTRYNGTRRYVGVCALFKSTEDYVYPDKLIRARVDLDEVENSFLAYGLNVGVSRSFIERRIRTTAGQSGISGGDIKKMPVVLCSKQEQDIIVSTLDEKLSETDSIISTLESKILKANLLKTSILHKAFQGKLVPQDPNDPPASELLAQIKAEREAKALAEKQAKQDKAASKSKAKTKSAKTPKKSKKDEQITLPL